MKKNKRRLLKPYYATEIRRGVGAAGVLYHADCLRMNRVLAKCSVDAIVTDPPAGIAFMGKKWDVKKGEGRARDAFVEWLTKIMRRCFRVLKPGGHALVWALPRTSHWTMTALEDVGFEIRDVITHLFGQGFPKSLDVSKAIVNRLGHVRKKKKVSAKIVRNPKSIRGGHGIDGGDRLWMKKAMEVGYHEVDGNEPVSDEANQWQGWGSALKPAAEFWILCRKPIEGSIAQNVLTHGTGALNVGKCRVGLQERYDAPVGRHENSMHPYKGKDGPGTDVIGRWPANVTLTHRPECELVGEIIGKWKCHPECPIRLLDAQSGQTRTPASPTRGSSRQQPFGMGLQQNIPCYGDFGGASRFFYTAKASPKDRGGRDNKHPTVKPLRLCCWLTRLITPPGGLVLDPFAGSGTIPVACLREGFRFVAFEKDEQNEGYLETIVKRVRCEERRIEGTFGF